SRISWRDSRTAAACDSDERPGLSLPVPLRPTGSRNTGWNVSATKAASVADATTPLTIHRAIAIPSTPRPPQPPHLESSFRAVGESAPRKARAHEIAASDGEPQRHMLTGLRRSLAGHDDPRSDDAGRELLFQQAVLEAVDQRLQARFDDVLVDADGRPR